MYLCDACIDLLKQVFNVSSYWDRPNMIEGSRAHVLVPSVFSSKTCSFCNFIKTLIIKQCLSPNWEADKEELVEFYDETFGSSPIYIHAFRDLHFERGPDSLRLARLTIDVSSTPAFKRLPWCDSDIVMIVWAPQGSRAHLSGRVCSREPLIKADSEETFTRICSWLDECFSDHWECKQRMSGEDINESIAPALPTRIIDVGPVDGTQQPKLVETRGSRGRYTALSHCWGPPLKHPLRTTRQTLQDHLRSIPLRKLPKTFRDAIDITRGIGLQYLWIDSLCIVQDDSDDWLRQSEIMGIIYENAHLTIAASAAEDPSQGCFLFDRSESTETVVLPCLLDSGEEIGSFYISSSPYDYLYPARSPLATRAWATQEWYLSRRTLHFMGEGLVWACRCLQIDDLEVRNDIEQYEDWKWLVEYYCSRRLTRESDRLIALQGLVNEMQKERSDRYYMGLWTGDMPEQLLWIRNQSEGLQRNQHLPDIPSWTWASMMGNIGFFHGKEGTVSICQTALDEGSGRLTISGPARKCWRSASSVDIWRQSIDQDEVVDLPKGLWNSFYSLEGEESSYYIRDRTWGNQDFIGLACFDSRAPHAEFLCVFLLKVKGQGRQSGRHRQDYMVLLLEPSPLIADMYRRIGMGIVTSEAWMRGAVHQEIVVV